MSIFDIAAFFLIMLFFHFLKGQYPNFLFFCKGAILYYLPQQTQLTKKKQKNKPNQHLLAFLRLEYQNCKSLMLVNDYDRISILLISAFTFIFIKLTLTLTIGSYLFSSSSFFFIVLVLCFAYGMKVGLSIFWISSYNVRTCILVGLGINVGFWVMYVLMGGIYDERIVNVNMDLMRHLQIVSGNTINILNKYVVMGIILSINFFITLVIIPTVIKFGNWYAKTLKQSYYGEYQQITEEQLVIKKRSKRTISYLNVYLFTSLGLIGSCHRYFLYYVSESILDSIRVLLLLISIFVILYTLKQAMQFNNSFTIMPIKEYYQSHDAAQKKQLRLKVQRYVSGFWFYVFQFAFRVIIPLAIFMTLMDWKYITPDNQPYRTTITNSQTATLKDIQCNVNMDPIKLLERMYQCETANIRSDYKLFVNGGIEADDGYMNMERIQARVHLFGFIWKPFMVQLMELLFWYSNCTLYMLTIIYIVFLRKAVYDI